MTNMGWGDFLLILAACGVAMLICRVLPLFLLKGRELPEGVSKALGFIPPAAFAALVRRRVLACRRAAFSRRRSGDGLGDHEVAAVERGDRRCRVRAFEHDRVLVFCASA